MSEISDLSFFEGCVLLLLILFGFLLINIRAQLALANRYLSNLNRYHYYQRFGEEDPSFEDD